MGLTQQTQALHEELREVGYCVVPGIIPGGKVAAIRESVLAAAWQRPTPGAAQQGVLHLPGLINYDRESRAWHGARGLAWTPGAFPAAIVVSAGLFCLHR